MGAYLRAGWGERARRSCSHSLYTVLVEFLHDRRLGDVRRSSLLEVLVRSGMRRILGCAIRSSLVPWKWHLVRSLRPGCRDSPRSLSRRHRHGILRSRPFRRNHLVRVVEARGGISRHAIEHALELGRVGSGRGMEECRRRINGRLVKSTIVMVRKVRGVGEPGGIHVECFTNPSVR